MVSAMAASALVNGVTASGLRGINEVAEYEKILKLRDEIFAGTHPRLAIANRTLTKVSPLPLPATQSPSAPQSNVPSFVSASQSSQLPGLGRGSEEPIQDHNIANNPETLRTLSEVDPVSLTNSDDLVKDELQRLRQRLEKGLKDQFEQKRLDARKRPAPGEAKPDFDVAAVLAKVLDLAKPDTSSSPGDEASLSSFDENSLYSSRAPDSTPEAGELEDDTPSQLQTSFAEVIGANASVETRTHAEKFHPAGPPPQSNEPRAEYDPMNPSIAGISRVGDLAADNDDEEDEEGEYSPPEAMEHVQANQDNISQPLDPRSRPLRRYSDVENGGPGSPHDGNYRIGNRARNGRNNQRTRGDRSPDGPTQGLHPRKKRKLEKQAGKRRRMGGGSPDVKDEPVSPPPFHDVQPLGSARLRPAGNEPIMIDDPPQEIRYVRANERYLDSPTRPMSRMVEPMMPLSEPRAQSRSVMQPLREETNLRRVASLQSMRAEQPQYVEQVFESPSRLRAASYVPVDSSMRSETSRYVPEVPMAYERDRAQSVRIVRTPAPAYQEMYRDAEPEIRYVSQPMPPPPPSQPIERIIVDEYGRKFREIIQERPSVAPRATPIYSDHERLVYDSYDRPRASSVLVGPGMDSRHVENMPPPPPRMLRPLADPPRQEVYGGVYPGGRAVSVAATDRPMTRQPVHLEENQDDRHQARVGSVRAMPSRYEERAPVQVISRASSVRPVGREGSVFVEDRPHGRREYIQMEPPQYQMTAPQTRYIDAQGREIIMEDAGQAGTTRYYPRY